MNSYTCIGRVGNMKMAYLNSGTSVMELSVAVDQSYKDKSGQKIERSGKSLISTDDMVGMYLVDCVCMREIAEKAGITASSVRKRLLKAGIKIRSVKESVKMAKGKYTDELLFKELYDAGKTYKEISKTMGIPEIRVSRVARKLGLRRVERHGFAGNGKRGRLYNVFYNMIGRCYKKENKDFKRYGGRGIYICDEWRSSFSAFALWAAEHGYRDDLVIDRIDSSGPYSPSNCRFVTATVNARENRSGVYMTKELADKIRSDRRVGDMPKEISARYNIPVRAVYSIVCNQRWV